MRDIFVDFLKKYFASNILFHFIYRRSIIPCLDHQRRITSFMKDYFKRPTLYSIKLTKLWDHIQNPQTKVRDDFIKPKLMKNTVRSPNHQPRKTKVKFPFLSPKSTINLYTSKKTSYMVCLSLEWPEKTSYIVRRYALPVTSCCLDSEVSTMHGIKFNKKCLFVKLMLW